MIKYVYVAGPYTGAEIQNIRAAIDAAEQLAADGFVPYLPHVNGLWDLAHPHPPEFWYEYDLEWLRKCDAMIRIPGPSAGADNEEDFACRHGIPVYHSRMELLRATRIVQDVPDSPDD